MKLTQSLQFLVKNDAFLQLKNIPALEITSLANLNISTVIAKWFQSGMESKKNLKTNNWSTKTLPNTRDKVSRVVRYCLDEIATKEELQTLKTGLPPANAGNYLQLKSLYTDACSSIEKNTVIKLNQLTSDIVSSNAGPEKTSKRKSPDTNIALISAVCKKFDIINKKCKPNIE